MSFDDISMVAQLPSSVATFAVAILLLRSLRLQHKDSVTSLGVGMTAVSYTHLTLPTKA